MSDFDFRRALLVIVSAPILSGLVAPGDWRRQFAIIFVYICTTFALIPWERK